MALRHYDNKNLDGSVVEIHIADIHFGAIDPAVEYEILYNQFIIPISKIKFDILAIDGDLFDKKFLASAPAVEYAMKFVMDCVNLCTRYNATMILLAGTQSHDADQLSMFSALSDSNTVDFRIVEHLQFEYAKGLKILCIPEEYGKDPNYYISKLASVYDTVFMHGTVVGSVYGANKYTLNSKKAPVFSIDAFSGCKGPIISGHVHKAACFDSYIYYVSNPVRYRFGEEEEKGFAIVLHSPKGHLYKFIPINSFRYDTINIDVINSADPNEIIKYLDNLKANGIDYIRIDFNSEFGNSLILDAQSMVERYYANDPRVSIKRYTESNKKTDSIQEEAHDPRFDRMKFLMDASLDGYTKFVNFVNYSEGKQIITVDQLKAVLSGQDINKIF